MLDFKHAEAVYDNAETMFEKYNDKFTLTGCPMKIDRDMVTGELLTIADW